MTDPKTVQLTRGRSGGASGASAPGAAMGAQPPLTAPWGPTAPAPAPWPRFAPGTAAQPGGSLGFGGRIRPPVRAAAVAACLVLGLGLLGGAAAGTWLADDSDDSPAAGASFGAARELWHSIPVDQIFPPTLRGEGAGPGGADRTWTRIAVAPDSGCRDAFDPLLAKALSPVGCKRLLRATYVDATTSSVTTVGLMVTKADLSRMRALHKRFAADGLAARSDLLPRPYAAGGTAAAGFGTAQRASWVVDVLTDVPAVVYAVTGFADGRPVTAPEPAKDAMADGATSAPAQAGLGHDARGIADRIERGFRKAADAATEDAS